MTRSFSVLAVSGILLIWFGGPFSEFSLGYAKLIEVHKVQRLLSQLVCKPANLRSVRLLGLLRACIEDKTEWKLKERFLGFGLDYSDSSGCSEDFVLKFFLLKWGLVTCTVNRIQLISPLTVFVSKSRFLRQVNDNLSSTALGPKDTKLEQMGKALVFCNMFREKAAPRN